jgi:hypothetical protein
MSEYLTPDDPGAFLGMEKKECPAHVAVMVRLQTGQNPEKKDRLTHECKQCKGYGGWNLELGKYGIGKHFKCRCPNCYGYGYVLEQFKDHIHEWEMIQFAPRFTPAYRCITCNELYDMELSG